MNDRTLHTELPFSCYGFITINGIIAGAPPGRRWLIGRRIQDNKELITILEDLC